VKFNWVGGAYKNFAVDLHCRIKAICNTLKSWPISSMALQ
jgi:hypothetical protein